MNFLLIKGYEEDNNFIELANIYYDGIDTEKDITKALELFIKVADIQEQEAHKNDKLSEIDKLFIRRFYKL